MSASDGPVRLAQLRLAELLCARMSHDLSGTIGTLAGALELVAEDPSATAEALALANQAASELRLRVEFQRACWGPESGPMSLAAVYTMATGLPHAHRTILDLSGLPDDTVFAAKFARMILNVLILADESLPAGGTITLAGNATDVVVGIAGTRAAWPSGLLRCLSSEAAAWAAILDARSLPMLLAALLAPALGLRLSVLLQGRPAGALPLLRLCEA